MSSSPMSCIRLCRNTSSSTSGHSTLTLAACFQFVRIIRLVFNSRIVWLICVSRCFGEYRYPGYNESCCGDCIDEYKYMGCLYDCCKPRMATNKIDVVWKYTDKSSTQTTLRYKVFLACIVRISKRVWYVTYVYSFLEIPQGLIKTTRAAAWLACLV